MISFCTVEIERETGSEQRKLSKGKTPIVFDEVSLPADVV